MAEETFDFWRDWKLDGTAKNVRVIMDLLGTPGYFAGSFLLTSLEITGNQDDGKINVTVTLQSNGEITWVDAP